MNNKIIRLTISSVVFVVLVNLLAFSQQGTASINIRDDAFTVKTTDQFESVYFSSTDNAGKIAVLQSLPMATRRFAINVKASSSPAMLSRILNDALASKEIEVVLSAINQIGSIGIVSYETIITKLFNDLNDTKNEIRSIRIRMAIIDALGGVATPGAITLLGQIIDAHQLNQETDEALISVGNAYATGLVPNIKAFVDDIETKIQKNEFPTDNKSVFRPEFLIARAQSTILKLSSR